MDNIIIYKNDYGSIEKEQVSMDMGETWEDTGNIRTKEILEEDSCKCGIHYRWVERGTICDYTEKRQLLILQQSQEGTCENWTDVTPTVAKMGDILEYDSDECGSVEYEIRYEEDCDGVNKVELGYYWIKEKYSNEWVKLECPAVDKRIIEYNSCDCGYFAYGEWYDSNEYSCGSELGSSYTSTSKYRKQYRDKICGDNILEEKYESRWILFESNSCECGYFTYGDWYDSNEYSCGSEIGETYTKTTKWRKQYRDKYCGGNIIETKADSKWIIFEQNSCDCGYTDYHWIKVGYECPNTENFVINSYTGKWIVEGNTFKSNPIYHNEHTTQRIYFSGVTKLYLSYIQDSEIYSDFLIVGKIDSKVVNQIDSSENFGDAQGKTSGEFLIGVPDTNEHFIELMFRRNMTGWDGTDSVTVTFGFPESEKNKPLLKEELRDMACSQGVANTRYTKAELRQVDGDFTCEYDEETKHNTTKKTQIILEYYDIIDSAWKPTPCIEGGVIDYRIETKSIDCGYNIRWRITGATCCGSLEGAINEPQYSCSRYPYASYNVEIEEITYNYNDETPIYEPTGRVRYGSVRELESESCGYVPKLLQWKLLCPDVTADKYQTPEDLDECVDCRSHQNAPSLFAIEYEQESLDGGLTWKDTGKTRTEKLLKWKSSACGYTGDLFENRVIEGTTYCDGTTLKGSTSMWVSSDNGVTWTEVPNSRTDGVTIEENSSECPNT